MNQLSRRNAPDDLMLHHLALHGVLFRVPLRADIDLVPLVDLPDLPLVVVLPDPALLPDTVVPGHRLDGAHDHLPRIVVITLDQDLLLDVVSGRGLVTVGHDRLIRHHGMPYLFGFIVSYVSAMKKKPLTEEERAAKLAEFQKDAVEHMESKRRIIASETERERVVEEERAARDKAIKDEGDVSLGPQFLTQMSRDVYNDKTLGTLEDRIKRNMHSTQRQGLDEKAMF